MPRSAPHAKQEIQAAGGPKAIPAYQPVIPGVSKAAIGK
jgi:hypothetical protein